MNPPTGTGLPLQVTGAPVNAQSSSGTVNVVNAPTVPGGGASELVKVRAPPNSGLLTRRFAIGRQ